MGDAWKILIGVVAFIAPLSAAHPVGNREQFDFSIERGSLAEVLRQFSQQTGLQVGTQLSVSESKTDEIGPYVGHATADTAMKELLKGSDLWFKWQDERTIAVFRISAQRALWSSGTATARQASDSIRALAGIHYETGSCGELLVGPFEAEHPISAEEFWIELIKSHCPVLYKRSGDIEAGSIDRLTAAGQAKHDFSIDEMPRFVAIRRISEQAGDLLIGYLSKDDEEERALVGPIHGRMSVNDALAIVMRGTELHTRWAEDNIVSIEPAYRVTAYADMSKCPCNFGLPELRPLRSEHVTVTGSRPASIEGVVLGRVAGWDRREIQASGASTIPDFLRHASQLPYMRPRGFRLNGAQFAEVRGLEPRYTLVLINGTREDVSASDLTTSAFDLNNIPMSAVERIEISAGSPSLVHGMDAIGGILNIVLRDSVPTPVADLRIGSASGGARERIGSVAAGTSTDRVKTALFIDYFETTELLGAARDRWRNMDHRRFGGPDWRSHFAFPPNVYTLDGSNLPGLDAPNAAVSVLPSGEVTFRSGETNLSSPFSMQAIAPAMKRTSISGMAQLQLGTSKLSAEALFAHRDAHFQLEADNTPGYVMAADHPQNPFGVPIGIDAALVGLPPQAIDSRSQLLRGVLKLEGPIGTGSWRYHSFVRVSKEQASAAKINFVDAAAVIDGLAATGDRAVNILGDRPGAGTGAALIAPRRSTSAGMDGSQLAVRVDGQLPLFRIDTTLGAEYRTESASVDELVGRADRHETSAFGTVTLPIGERFRLTYGTRVDDFSDFERVRRGQWGLSWRPTSVVEFRAAYNEAFHAPSILDLRLPRQTVSAPMFDPQRQEVTTVDFISGGNPDLAPTTGASSTLGFVVNDGRGFVVSVDLWRIRMRDHISMVSPFALLANESEVIVERIERDAPTALDDQAGRPGRLLALDVSRANVGAVDARGVDISVQNLFQTSVGELIPRLDLTYTDAFRYSDLPIVDAPMRDRAGIASVLGTIPSWHGTCSLQYSADHWGGGIFARYHSSYADYDSANETILDRRIPSRVFWDLTISRKLGARMDLTVGVSDVMNRAPAYAQVYDLFGYDVAQDDLAGRIAFIRIQGSM